MLTKANWSAVPSTLPVIALAFVYQNVVPVITANLGQDAKKVTASIVLGVLLPFLMFVSWDAAVLGTSSPATSSTASMSSTSQSPQNTAAEQGADGNAPQLASPSEESTSGGGDSRAVDPLLALKSSNTSAAPLIESFSFLAITTSYIGFILGLTDFLADGLKLEGGAQQPLPYLLTVLPPFFLAITYPDIFYQALDTAGTYGVMTLFGFIPAAMAYNQRYGTDSSGQEKQSLPATELVPGGKPVLAAIAGAAVYVIVSNSV